MTFQEGISFIWFILCICEYCCLGFFASLLAVVISSFVNISPVIGWNGWVFCASQETGWED